MTPSVLSKYILFVLPAGDIAICTTLSGADDNSYWHQNSTSIHCEDEKNDCTVQ